MSLCSIDHIVHHLVHSVKFHFSQNCSIMVNSSPLLILLITSYGTCVCCNHSAIIKGKRSNLQSIIHSIMILQGSAVEWEKRGEGGRVGIAVCSVECHVFVLNLIACLVAETSTVSCQN